MEKVKVVDFGNAVQVKDINLYDDDECKELGRIAAHECIVFVDDAVTEKRLHDLQLLWGVASKTPVHKMVAEGRLRGRHWRRLMLHIGHISKAVQEYSDTMSRVSFIRDEKDRPTGVFSTGKLDWHCDQQSHYEKQRIIGLMSLHSTEGSQTTFLRTSEMYESLNHEDRSMVDELMTVWEWDGRPPGYDLKDPGEVEMLRYAVTPLDGIECPLRDETATGRKGLRFPNNSFSHFKGMSKEESHKYRNYLWTLLDKPEYVYTRDWKDGQLMFMDQNITLHARPTNVTKGNDRTLVRNITHVNHLFPNQDPVNHYLYNGDKLDYETFATMVDEKRKREYEEEK
jgi:alpha-ketoglutarate-dependent taurine dioxygenase